MWSFSEVDDYAKKILSKREMINSYKSRMVQQQSSLYKEVLEVLQMPVTNPKTGEQDYVDISKVSSIILDPVTVFNLQNTSDKLKISFDLKPLGVADVVLGAVPGSAKNEQETVTIPLTEFEEMLAECVYSESDLRLEHVKGFRNCMNILVSNILQNKKNKHEYYVETNVRNPFKKGIGFIVDERVQREIGTFEHMEITHNGDLECLFVLPFLQGKQAQEIANEPDGFAFIFYSLEDKCIYHIKPRTLSYSGESTNIQFFSTDVYVSIEQGFTEKHSKYPMVEEAEGNKLAENILEKMDLNDSINKMQFDEFKESRLKMLKDSQEKAKREKIVSQFEDIDLF